MAKKKIEMVVPKKVLSPREILEGEIAGLEHAYKYYRAQLLNSSTMIKDRFTEAANDLSTQLNNAASDEYLLKHPDLTTSEITSWTVNSLIWILPNLHIENLMREATRLDKTRKELAGKREELAILLEKEDAKLLLETPRT